MISLLKKLFIQNWQRKVLGFILAIITWAFVNHSLYITKTIANVPVRVINLSKDKTIKGMESDGTLLDTLDLSIHGNKNLLDQMTKNDIEILIDLKDNKKEEYTTLITKNNIISTNPNINIERIIKKLHPQEFTLKLSKFVVDKIPVLVSQPTGDAPKGYLFSDVWPCTLYTTVSGPEEIVKKLKTEGLKLTFNLNAISQQELDAIDATMKRGQKDIISFFVPTSWKKINVPEISLFPLEVDDPNAKALRMEFTKDRFIPIEANIPVILFFPTNTSDKLNPVNISIANNDFVKKINGIDMITTPLYAQGVSEQFINTIKEKMYIIISVISKENTKNLDWHVQLILPSELEKSFIKKIITEKPNEEARELQPHMLEENLKFRFRTYSAKLKLWISPTEILKLKVKLENNKIHIIPVKD